MATSGEDDLGDFFAEINEIEAVVSSEESDETSEGKQPEQVKTVAAAAAPVIISQVVTSKPAELKQHTVYTYDESVYGGIGTANYAEPAHQEVANATYSNYQSGAVASSSSTSNLAAYTANNAQPQSASLRTNQKFVRKAADEIWVDETLKEWPENDFRVFVGDLAKDTTTDMLVKAFNHYPSLPRPR
ncbi:hypothetical protein EON65_42610 [archaeon]|nr:MAG: hypothetical protein EON65_42610 [archaeon]